MQTNIEILKALIKLSGLSKTKYSEKHEIEPSQLSRWLSGDRGIRFCTLQLLAFEDGKEINIEYKIKEL